MFLKSRQREKRSSSAYSLPPRLRVYAVGDIHGRADCLRELQAVIVEHAADDRGFKNIIVYLGDYLDRGPCVRETLDELIDRSLSGFDSIHLMGNHERMLLDFLDDPAVLKFWLDNGGMATLLSYGVKVSAGTSIEFADDLRNKLKSAIPGSHIEFLRNLKLYYKAGDYIFVHAGIRPGVPLEEQDESGMLWIGEEFSEFEGDHGSRVVYGHSVQSKPLVKPNRIGVDAGAYATGILTCAVLEGDRVQFLSNRHAAGDIFFKICKT